MGEVAAEARTHTAAALRTLVGLMEGSPKDEVRCRAAEALLDRGWGRAPQAIVAALEVATVDVEGLRAQLLARATAMAVPTALPPAVAEPVLPALAAPEEGR